jgi:O-antigen/teichoic acid export membrane protein
VALNSVSAAWTSTKAPRFSMLVANKQIRELDKLFFTSTAQSLFVCLIGGLTFLLGLHFLHGKLELVSRFLEVQETALLLIGTVVFQITSAQSSYLRAHKKEPLMWQTVINGVLTLIGIFIFGKLYGAKGVVISYATVQVLNLLCTTAIWRHCKKKWHA